jgi:hypothetical protein
MCRSGGWSTFEVGKTLLEVTQIGKGSHTRCAIYCQASDCVMPKEGIVNLMGLARNPADLLGQITPIQSSRHRYPVARLQRLDHEAADSFLRSLNDAVAEITYSPAHGRRETAGLAFEL